MTCEETIQSMFDYWPCLFVDRADALNHLFCTIGNGYEWIDGQLVSCITQDAPPKNPLKDGKAFQYQPLSLRAQALYYRNQRYPGKPLDELKQKQYDRIPDDKTHRHPRKERWYFYRSGLCEDFAYLFNYPENIQPDWKAALEECRSMLREDGYPV